MATPHAFIATTRFGFGPKPGELNAVSADPRGWLDAQLQAKYAAATAGQPTTIEIVRALRDMVQAKRFARGAGEGETAEKVKSLLKDMGKDYLKQAAVRTRAAAESQAPFLERLVQFWSNHFTVSITKPQDLALVVAFERDAIRPHVLGNFHAMLRASTRHPAMQLYLDNFRSVGPKSLAGRMKGKGLNENLAREILELHTLGVDGGYTQKDVTEFARILTGWTIDARGKGDGSGFFFAPVLHEPGPKTLLGTVYASDGVREGERALEMLAHHPSTAKFIAAKLARHFIADEPPASAVSALEAAFVRHRGELLPLYRTLLSLKEAWEQPLAKAKTPNDYIMSILRCTGAAGVVDDIRLVGAFKMLGQVPFNAPSPAGWSDRGRDWIGAEALLQRLEIARLAARGAHTRMAPERLMEETIGPVASAETRQAVARAGSPEEAITLLFASPEFQRR